MYVMGGGQPLNKKAFTLIELLAVIVILAIIALIATPIVLDIIEDARSESAERSMENIEKAAELYYYENDLNDAFTGITFICKEGVCSKGEETLNISGKGPESGTIKIDATGNITLNSIVINGYSCYKDGDSYSCKRASKTTEKTNNGVLNLNESKTTTLSNYIINGNSYQETRSGKNLFDASKIKNTEIVVENDGQKMTMPIAESGVGYVSAATSLSNLCPNLNVGDQVILSFDTNSTHKYIYLYGINIYWINGETQTITQEMLDSTVLFYGNNYNQGDYEQKIITNFQIEKGSIATDYEEYGAMPSLEFPSEVQSVGDLVTDSSDPNYGKYEIPIRVIGKNLFDINLGLNNILTTNDDNTYTMTMSNYGRYSKVIPIKIPAGTTVKVSSEFLDSSTTKQKSVYLLLKYDDGSSVYMTYPDTTLKQFVKDIVSIRLYLWAEEDEGAFYSFKNLQVELGESSTDYEPYKEENYTITLDEPLRCVGEVCDYIDYENQRVVRKVEVIDTTGTKTIEESFNKLSNEKYESIELPEININKGVSNIYIETDINPSEFIVDYYK